MENKICAVCGMFECEKYSNKCSSCNDCIKHSLKHNKDNFSYRDWVLDGVKNKLPTQKESLENFSNFQNKMESIFFKK